MKLLFNCYGIVNTPGVYLVFLNWVEQDVTVYVYNVSLSNAFSITPQVVKWIPPSFETYITIKFDSNIAHTTKSIQLRPLNPDYKNAELTVEKRLNYVYSIFSWIFLWRNHLFIFKIFIQ